MRSIPSSLFTRGSWFASLLAILLVVSACSDSVVAPEEAVGDPAGTGSKFRHQHLVERAKTGAGKTDGLVNLIVGLENTVLDKQAVLHRYSVLHRYGVLHRYDFETVFNGMAITVPSRWLKELVAAMESDPDIRWIEPSIPLPAPRRKFSMSMQWRQLLPWSIRRIGGAASSQKSGNGSGAVENVDLFIVDTGVSSSDLNVVSSYDMSAMVNLEGWEPEWYDPEESEGWGDESDDGGQGKQGRVHQASYGDDSDYDGHGTHVAGIAAAIDDRDGIVGVAPGARVHNFKIAGPSGTTDIATAVYAVEQITKLKLEHPDRPMVVSFCFGADIGTERYNSLDEAIRASIEAGVVYVLAAGNGGMDAATITPAHVTEALTVGSFGFRNRFSSFSNYGPAVDVLAPGEGILSLVPETGSISIGLQSGTSMAAGHAAGAAALYLSLHPDATPAQVRDALVSAGRAKRVRRVPGGTSNISLHVAGL